MTFSPGMTVRCRGQRCLVLESHPLPSAGQPAYRLLVRALEGSLRDQEWPVLSPLESVIAEDLPALSLDRVGRDQRFQLLHDAFRLTLAPPPGALVAADRSRVRYEPYQQIPALRLLALPRPRLLNASDVGLGKTIETGIALRELIARRRGDRILILAPAGICEQWQDEMRAKFGLDFQIFDRDGVHTARQRLDRGVNPWAVESRIIASFDYLKRRDGAFREVQHVRFSVIVCDEVHHLADNSLTKHVADRHRLAQWVASASDALLLLSATPHSGNDESFASLLNLLEPTLAPPDEPLDPKRYMQHVVRHLKRHIRNEDGSPLFVLPEPSQPLPVQLPDCERAVHAAVSRQAGRLDSLAEQAKSNEERFALRLVATVLRKRAASSLAALRRTVVVRTENIAEDIRQVELHRDHLRALRKGETVPDDVREEIERDGYRSYLAGIRAAGEAKRLLESELAALKELQELLDACPPDTEAKAERLLAELLVLHREQPVEKVIVFSEYAATVEWLAEYLDRNGYAGRHVVFQGEMNTKQRRDALARFASPDAVLLLSTDAASEGLNLQEHCCRVLHCELPFNPNRMLQRQGRVDRYGQKRPCRFAYLYAADTYEGEVLDRIFRRIENQVRALGSVGDVLGCLQVDRVEEMISKSPPDLKRALQDAERAIEQELAAVNRDRAVRLMGDEPSASEWGAVKTAREEGRRVGIEAVDFVVRAVNLAGGVCRREGADVRIERTPPEWVGGRVQAAYESLFAGRGAIPAGVQFDEVLDEDHPLTRAAVRWVRGSRFNSGEKDIDHRLAARVLAGLDRPDLVATFLATVRADDGTEMERLLAVRVDRDGFLDPNDASELLYGQGLRNWSEPHLRAAFGPWWEEGVRRAENEAKKRADLWCAREAQTRHRESAALWDQLRHWNEATRRAILANHTNTFESMLPPAVQRRLALHRQDVEARQKFLEDRLRLRVAAVESLGVLLRLPESEAR